MSCCCNNIMYGRPCCCPSGTTTTTTIPLCENAETCAETYTTDCVIYMGESISLPCLTVEPGDSYTEIIQNILTSLESCEPVVLCNFNAVIQDITPPPVCYCYTVVVQNTIGSCFVSWKNCDGTAGDITLDPTKEYGVSFCAQEGTVTTECYNDQTCTVTVSQTLCSVDGDCPPPPPFNCQCYYLSVPAEGTIGLSYKSCDGQLITLNPGESGTYCIRGILALGDGIANWLGTNCEVDGDCPDYMSKEMCFVFEWSEYTWITPIGSGNPVPGDLICQDYQTISVLPSGIYNGKPYYEINISFDNCPFSLPSFTGYIISGYSVYPNQQWELWGDPNPFDPNVGPDPDFAILASTVISGPNQFLPITNNYWQRTDITNAINILTSPDPDATNGICNLNVSTISYIVNTCTDSLSPFEILVMNIVDTMFPIPFSGTGYIGINPERPTEYIHGTYVQIAGITPDTGDTIITVTNITTSDIVVSQTYPPSSILTVNGSDLSFYTIGGNEYMITIIQDGCP